MIRDIEVVFRFNVNAELYEWVNGWDTECPVETDAELVDVLWDHAEDAIRDGLGEKRDVELIAWCASD